MWGRVPRFGGNDSPFGPPAAAEMVAALPLAQYVAPITTTEGGVSGDPTGFTKDDANAGFAATTGTGEGLRPPSRSIRIRWRRLRARDSRDRQAARTLSTISCSIRAMTWVTVPPGL